MNTPKAWVGGDRCKYCGYLDLEWRMDAQGKSYLSTPNGSRHRCKPYKRTF